MLHGNVKIYQFRVRLPSGRSGASGVIADNYTTAYELANHLYPGMVLTIPTPREIVEERDTSNG